MIHVKQYLLLRGYKCPPFQCVTVLLFIFITSDTEQYSIPHIHAKFQDFSASFAIESGEKLAGDFPIGKARMVQAWIEIHREALMADWNLAVNGQAIFKIPALQEEDLA